MKGLARAFQQSRFGTEEEARAFVALITEAPRAEVLKCYEFLVKSHAQMPSAHYRLHCQTFLAIAQRGAQKSLFVPLIRGLATPNTLLVETLCTLLPRMNHPSEHKELCLLLGHSERNVRRAAADVLEKVFHAQTTKFLVAACQARQFQFFDLLLELLVRLQRPDLKPCLAVVIGRGDRSVQEEATGILQMPSMVGITEPEARDLLLTLINIDDDVIASQALSSLGAVCDEPTTLQITAAFLEHPSFRRVTGALRSLAHHRTPRVFSLFADKIIEGPTQVRMEVLGILEEMGTDDVIPGLVTAISQDDLKAQSEAVRVLRSLTASGEIEVTRTLLWLLRSNDVNVRRLASEVIDAIPEPRDATWPRLLSFLRDEDWWVRERVLDALVKIAGFALTRYLAGLLDDPSRTLRRLAVEGLAKLEDPESIGTLVRCAQADEDWWVREAAVAAIGKLADQRAIPHVLAVLRADPQVAVACIDTLRALAAEDALDDVLVQLDGGSVDIQLAALDFLAVLKRPDLAPHVQPLVMSEDVELGAKARAVLDAWSVQLLVQPKDDDDPEAILDAYLNTLLDRGGDDLIFSSGQRVFIKVRGEMVPITEVTLSAENVFLILQALLEGGDIEALGTLRDLDLSYRSKMSGARFRVNVFQAQHGLGAVFRVISDAVPSLQKLGLPAPVLSFSHYPHGLVLVGGPPGSGKSTTLSAIVNDINEREPRHLLTIEDPIEAVHKTKRALINQREVGRHCESFNHAMRSMLRQDPDVILIGELRDLESVEFALRAAETGHLVFATVHTFAADTTVDRLLNVFPAAKQEQARGMLADSLRAVLCQFLLPDVLTGGRVIAAELMLRTDSVANMIRKNQTHQIPSLLQVGAEQGQVTMDTSLARLYLAGRISDAAFKLRLRNKDLFDEVSKVKNEQRDQAKAAAQAAGQVR